LEEPDSKRRRRLESAELPTGVADGVVQTLTWNNVDVWFGVVCSGTPFWQWSAGRSFLHVWTCDISGGMAAAVLESKLNEDSVDAIFIESKCFGCGHAVWSVPGLKIIVWY
jgi:hypothetical protein